MPYNKEDLLFPKSACDIKNTVHSFILWGGKNISALWWADWQWHSD